MWHIHYDWRGLVMAIEVFRTSTQRFPHGGYGQSFGRATVHTVRYGKDDPVLLAISFKTTQSAFTILIEQNSFAEVAQSMMKADASEAMKAFGAALQIGLPQPTDEAKPDDRLVA
jgi:hypothetical protein